MGASGCGAGGTAAVGSANACAGHEGAMDLLSGIAIASGGCAERTCLNKLACGSKPFAGDFLCVPRAGPFVRGLCYYVG